MTLRTTGGSRGVHKFEHMDQTPPTRPDSPPPNLSDSMPPSHPGSQPRAFADSVSSDRPDSTGPTIGHSMDPVRSGPPVQQDLFTRRFLAIDFDRAASPIALGTVAVAAVVFDWVVFDGLGGVGFFIFMCAVVASLVLLGTRRPAQLVLLGAVVALASIWVFRESGWLRLTTTLLIAVCLFITLTAAKYREIFDLRSHDFVVGVVDACVEAVASIPWVLRGVVGCLPRTHGRATEFARIILIGLPTLLLVAILLVASDILIESLISAVLENLLVHGVIFAFGFAVVAVLVRCAIPATPDNEPRSWKPSRTESWVILGGLAGLLTVFVAIQSAALLHPSYLSDHNVNYAEYARSGYVQLLAVTAIITCAVLAFDRSFDQAATNRKLNRTLALVLIALTLIVLAIAVTRLLRYCEAFGLTMTRLVCIPFAVWIALMLVMLAARVLGFHRQREWFIGTATIALVVIWLGFAAANPQAMIVRYDVNQFGAEADLRYLTSMSDDAVPQLLSELQRFDPAQVTYIHERLCPRRDESPSFLQDNWSAVSARGALESACQ